MTKQPTFGVVEHESHNGKRLGGRLVFGSDDFDEVAAKAAKLAKNSERPWISYTVEGEGDVWRVGRDGRVKKAPDYYRNSSKKEGLEGLHGRRFDSWDSDDPQSSLDPRKDGRWFMPEHLHMGDYDNAGSVGASNVRVWEDEFKSGRNKWWYLRTEGYGGRVILIDTTKEIPEEAIDVLAALEDYPLISDDDHSQLEMEWQSEAYESWGRNDFRKALAKEFPEKEGKIERMSKKRLDELFWEVSERANIYWEMESSSAYIDVEKVASKAKESDL